METRLIQVIIFSFIAGFVVGWFLPYLTKRTKKIVGKEPFQFFHKEKLYNFNDALVLLKWYHGDDGHIHTHLVRFPDGIYFRINFGVSSLPPEVVEYSKEEMIKSLREEVKSFPKEALAALKLFEF